MVLTLISLGVFLTYVCTSVRLFGVPKSLSETYYLFKDKGVADGYVFTFMMWICAGLLLVPMIDITPSLWQFTAFLSLGAIAFVGAAPAFRRNRMESDVHCWSAKAAAVLSLVWSCLVMGLWPVAIASLAVCALLGWCSKTLRRAYVFWLEMVAFLDVYVCLLHLYWL